MLPKCPRTESSSVLKRPSDSDSALFSVTPRDHLVYASGSVRSTASNNAPYIDRERETHTHTNTHTSHIYTSGHTSYIDAQELKLKETRNSEATHISSHFPVATQVHLHTHTHFEFYNKVHRIQSEFVLFW